MVVPGGTYLARDGQMRAPRDGLSDPGRHHHCTASPIRSTGNLKNPGLWNPAGWLKPPFRLQGKLPQPAPTNPASSGSRLQVPGGEGLVAPGVGDGDAGDGDQVVAGVNQRPLAAAPGRHAGGAPQLGLSLIHI